MDKTVVRKTSLRAGEDAFFLPPNVLDSFLLLRKMNRQALLLMGKKEAPLDRGFAKKVPWRSMSMRQA